MHKVHKAITARRDAILQGERRDGGFTLIELLIVVLIIGVLAAIAIPVYLSTVDSAKNEAAKSTVSQAITSLQAHLIEEGEYPAGTGLTTLTNAGFRAPGSEITVTYTGTTDEFCVTATPTGSSTGFHADQNDGAPQEGNTCS